MNGAGQPGLFEDEGAHDDGHPAPAPHTMARAEDPGTSKEAAVDLVLSGRVQGCDGQGARGAAQVWYPVEEGQADGGD